MATAADIAAARAELDHARALVADWKQRGSPPFEESVLTTRLAAAEAAVANAIGPTTGPTWPQREVGPFALPPSSNSNSPRARAAKTATRPPAGSPDHDALINHETNARFWAQTGYKVGQKLDANNPTDKAMIKAWLDVHAKVLREDKEGRLVVTYNNPALGEHLRLSEEADQAAAAHLDAAATAQADPYKAPEIAQDHIKAATQAISDSQQHAQKAASLQPPTVSPEVVKIAAHDAHAAAGLPPPNVKLLPDQRGRWHPNAAPSSPDLAKPSIPDVVAPPQTAADHVALVQVAAAPDVAGAVHEAAATDADAGVKPADDSSSSSGTTVAAVIAAVAASAGLFILARRRG
jgi:hypothetical protein